MENLKKYAAEFLGTAILVFMGCGSAMVLGCDINGGHLAVAFTFGLSIVAMAYVIGNISGCHINPAVSLGVLLSKRMSVKDFCGYVVSQLLGGVLGAGLLKIFMNFGMPDLTGGMGTNGTAVLGIGGSIVLEIVLTCIFVFTILGVTDDESKGSVAGVVIGLTLTFVHIVGIPLTGTSVNPARSLGPALFAGGDALSNVWVFIVAPLAGAVVAAALYSLLNTKKKA